MKEKELRKHATCSMCSNPIGASGLPFFWTVRVERHGIRMNAVRRQDGLAMLLGNANLAQVMGADEEMTEILLGPVKLTLCENCALLNDVIEIALLKDAIEEESPPVVPPSEKNGQGDEEVDDASL